jgi:hypothetical protein
MKSNNKYLKFSTEKLPKQPVNWLQATISAEYEIARATPVTEYGNKTRNIK